MYHLRNYPSCSTEVKVEEKRIKEEGNGESVVLF
jgi:hypothetical protein